MTVQDNVVSSASGTPAPGPSGLGGWLILPILGFIGALLITGFNFWQSFQARDGLVAVFKATSAPLADLKIPMAMSLIFGVLLIVSAAYCLYLAFTKNQKMVKFATIHYVILAIVGIVELWAGNVLEKALPDVPRDPGLIKDAARGVIVACIWIPYFRVSKRVKNTFGPSDSEAAKT